MEHLNKQRNQYITWAVINNKIEWIDGQIDHKEWLKHKFKITERQFEETISGFIRGNSQGKIEIIYFKGSGFDECSIDTKLLATVILIADLRYSFEQILIYSGIKSTKIKRDLDTLRLKEAYKVLTKINVSDKLVSIKQIIEYEAKIVNLVNSTIYSNKDILQEELILCKQAFANYISSEQDPLNYELKRRIITYSELL